MSALALLTLVSLHQVQVLRVDLTTRDGLGANTEVFALELTVLPTEPTSEGLVTRTVLPADKMAAPTSTAKRVKVPAALVVGLIHLMREAVPGPGDSGPIVRRSDTFRRADLRLRDGETELHLFTDSTDSPAPWFVRSSPTRPEGVPPSFAMMLEPQLEKLRTFVATR